MPGMPRFRDDDRVTVVDPHDRHYGEHGYIECWWYGMGGGVMYGVILDGRADDGPLPKAETELQLGEEVFTR